MRSPILASLLVSVASLLALSCSSKATSPQSPSNGADPDAATMVEDLNLMDGDFDCILGPSWTKVRDFRITNKLGNNDGSLAVANNPGSGDYPVGTVIQLIPTEAMVKRGVGFSSETNDWEFFSLAVTAAGATISNRGTDMVVNSSGGNCFSCHDAAAGMYDFVCETNHGCVALPFTSSTLQIVQSNDPRCPK